MTGGQLNDAIRNISFPFGTFRQSSCLINGRVDKKKKGETHCWFLGRFSELTAGGGAAVKGSRASFSSRVVFAKQRLYYDHDF